MSDFYSKNYQKNYIDNPSSPAAPGEIAGRVRVMYAEFECPNDVMAVNDKIFLGKLKQNSRILKVECIHADLGTTGKLEIGHLANNEESEDLGAFIEEVDLTDDGFQASADEPGIFKKFISETELVANFDTATTAAEGGLIKILIYYVQD